MADGSNVDSVSSNYLNNKVVYEVLRDDIAFSVRLSTGLFFCAGSATVRSVVGVIECKAQLQPT